MVGSRSLVTPTSSPQLEKALREKLSRRNEAGGSLGELEPLAIRLGLMQDTLTPVLHDPQLLLFAADHGLVVDGICEAGVRSTHETVQLVLDQQLPLAVFARAQGLAVTVVDCGMAQNLPPHERLLMRKIAHGTRNARVSHAMSIDQAHAAIRAGMEIGDSLRGNLVALAGVGLGSAESAALVLSRLADLPLRDLVSRGTAMNPEILSHLLSLLQSAQSRHRDVQDPVEVLAAFGGFETGAMVGVMLVAASKRHLVMIDGITACAALLIASRIAPAVTDYCVFCRSTPHAGLDMALQAFQASALLDLGLDTMDGTGACLVWPLVQAAAALLADPAQEEAAASRPASLSPGLGTTDHEPPRDEGDPTVPSRLG